jgi:hypothetical protein
MAMELEYHASLFCWMDVPVYPGWEDNTVTSRTVCAVFQSTKPANTSIFNKPQAAEEVGRSRRTDCPTSRIRHWSYQETCRTRPSRYLTIHHAILPSITRDSEHTETEFLDQVSSSGATLRRNLS